jgi:hypothetical protein
MRGRLIIVAAAACLAAVPPAGAAANARCGAAVLKDWADGKLDRTYRVGCYQNALNRMPEDMRSYTTAPDDIQRALLARLRAGRMHHARSTAQARSAKASRRPAAAAPARTDRQTEREALSAAGLEASGSTGFPRPLVALAAVGLLLLTAGSAGIATRKLRS